MCVHLNSFSKPFCLFACVCVLLDVQNLYAVYMQSLPVDDVFVAQVVQSQGDFTHVVLHSALCKVHILL